MMRTSGWQRQGHHLVLAHTGTRPTSEAVLVPVSEEKVIEEARPSVILKPVENRPEGDQKKNRPATRTTRSVGEMKSDRARIAELDQQLALKTSALQKLDRQVALWAQRVSDADKHASALDAERNALREDLANRENQNHSLKTSLGLLVVENSHLSDCIIERDSTIERIVVQLEQANAALKAEKSERSRLAAAANAASETHQARQDELQTSLAQVQASFELTNSRAIAAENALAEIKQGRLNGTAEAVAVVNEMSRLSRHLIESNDAANTARFERDQMAVALAAMRSECTTLSAPVVGKEEKLKTETEQLRSQLEMMTAHAANANALLARVRESLLGKFEILEQSIQNRQRSESNSQEIRSTLEERASSLSNTLKIRDMALGRAKKTINKLANEVAMITEELAESQDEIEKLKCELVTRREKAIAQTRNGHQAGSPPPLAPADGTIVTNSEDSLPTQGRFIETLLAETITF